MNHLQDMIIPVMQENETQEENRNNVRQKEVTSYDQLPVALKADQVAAVLGISRAEPIT